jgi:hypothetical protein
VTPEALKEADPAAKRHFASTYLYKINVMKVKPIRHG